jgi:glycosyltransferase involved in cell wall biosynthesis
MSDRFTIIPARNDIPKIVPGLDIFVLSSAWGEAFPLSVGEAMASEVPAVVTQIGDCDWLVGDTGEIVEASNPQALASGIEAILKMSKSEKTALGKKARKRIENLFSLEKYIDEHATLYDQVIQQYK